MCARLFSSWPAWSSLLTTNIKQNYRDSLASNWSSKSEKDPRKILDFALYIVKKKVWAWLFSSWPARSSLLPTNIKEKYRVSLPTNQSVKFEKNPRKFLYSSLYIVRTRSRVSILKLTRLKRIFGSIKIRCFRQT